ncbi:DUF1501 domain-containing protein [Pseudoxanthomonas composti]|uniref:DUF1501 domain-containing protein n=1 Tax=Pseudoxanthomonas composti TaxID=2137479 RepID=A0A4Q1JTV6_9GAMM|nr:DUF1501 domain-containing protein [Pseudoxanthomonas composti]RXR01402.1 DUF1501 domain-containing protein [Pseudoxanthomonas composti]
MNEFRNDRREFLRKMQLALAGGAIAATVPQLELVGRALAQSAPAGNYRALVCIFLLGGNDSFNLLVPHAQSEHEVYLRSRGGVYDASSNGQGLGIARDALLPVTDTANKTWGLHPACPEMKTLFDAGELAFMANVGTLVQPITKAEYVARSKRVPASLFSHNDQQRLWMRGESERPSASTGWGGTLADRLRSANSAGLTQLPPTISVSGNNLFQNGTSTTPYVMASSGPAALRNFENVNNTADRTRREALAAMMARSYTPLMADQYSMLGESAMYLSSRLRTALDPANGGDIATVFPASNNLGAQLRMIARSIKASRTSAINHSRQIYFASMGGFDTHDSQMSANGQPRLLAQVSAALGAFRTALAEIGALNDTVTFSMSDFGRTLNSNGNGTDHAWGGVQFMMGGAAANGGPLQGRRVHGSYPLLELDGDQAIDRGRIIPTTSTNQFGATFARWMGVGNADLPTIFPGLGNFPQQTLGFLGT